MPDNESPLAPLLGALHDLVRWMEATATPHVIAGGVAASVLGRPRTTRDIDVLGQVAKEEDWPAFVESAAPFGIVPRIGDCLDFARASRVLLLIHTVTGIAIDFVLAGLPYEFSIIARARDRNAGPVRARFPRVEDLIVMKLLARRPRDMGDLEGLIQATDHLDWAYIREWVRQFAAALDASDLIPALDRLERSARPEGPGATLDSEES